MLLAVGFAWALGPQVSFEETCRLAPVVVVAEVTTVEARWATGPVGGIETAYDLAVSRVLVGTVPAPLQVVVPGGALDGVRITVEDAPTLLPDHRYVLALTPRDGGGWRPFGGANGVLALDWQVDAERFVGVCDAPR